MKKKNALKSFTQGSAEFVVAHGLWQKSRGRNPSLAFGSLLNPRLAFSAAKKMLAECGGRYNVVFCYTALAGGYRGVRTWTAFLNKKEFDRWYTDDIRARESVVREGVTENEAVALVSKTPTLCYVAAVFDEATEPDGSINLFRLKMGMESLLFIEAMNRREEAGRTLQAGTKF